jgi:hypothetical protein
MKAPPASPMMMPGPPSSSLSPAGEVGSRCRQHWLSCCCASLRRLT